MKEGHANRGRRRYYDYIKCSLLLHWNSPGCYFEKSWQESRNTRRHTQGHPHTNWYFIFFWTSLKLGTSRSRSKLKRDRRSSSVNCSVQKVSSCYTSTSLLISHPNGQKLISSHCPNILYLLIFKKLTGESWTDCTWERLLCSAFLCLIHTLLPIWNPEGSHLWRKPNLTHSVSSWATGNGFV